MVKWKKSIVYYIYQLIIGGTLIQKKRKNRGGKRDLVEMSSGEEIFKAEKTGNGTWSSG